MPLPQRSSNRAQEAALNTHTALQSQTGTTLAADQQSVACSSNGAPVRAVKSDTHTFELSIISNVPAKESERLLDKVGRSVGIDFFGLLFTGEVKVTSYESGGCKLYIKGGSTGLQKLHPLCLEAAECKDFVSVLVRQAEYKA